MKEKIVEALSRIEAEHEVKIIYACEAGSRAWGTASEESDYDVRFIYIHPVSWYLSIEQKREVMDIQLTAELDMVGWDMRKTLALLKKSNPTILEWLQSRIVYHENPLIVAECKSLSKKTFSEKTCLYHYLNMAKRNAKGSFHSPDAYANVKLVLNVVKPLLACRWIKKYHSMPPNEFVYLMDHIPKSGVLRTEVEAILEKKLKREKEISINELGAIQKFIEEQIGCLTDYVKRLEENKKADTDAFDQLFQRTLKTVWN
ncbi:nucleotidyltransferase domain-containing protein [Alkalihalobacterium elongatum]|uniref:nucleotidyltransferase domain-containing protein n=1 Tax=Alkalihalobacterium elongatum TaxID=2675466 RepID=UPI001C1F22FC|nr:nucleotidyltransferase domain-containing protein [Alkalihalobacterium elongatum]